MCKSIKAIICFFVILCLVGSQSAIAETIYYYHTDPVGTPLAMTDASGQKVWEADYLPFGEVHTESGMLNDRKFVGKERDEESDLDYFGARFHYAKVGRFLAVDPVRAVSASGKINQSIISDGQRQNVYAYSLNNPYKYLDPDGRDIVWFGVASSAEAGSGDDKNGKTGGAAQGAYGVGYNTDTGKYFEFVTYGETDSKKELDGAEGLGFGTGFSGGYFEGSQEDFLGETREISQTVVLGTYTATINDKGQEGWSLSLGEGLGYSTTSMRTSTVEKSSFVSKNLNKFFKETLKNE